MTITKREVQPKARITYDEMEAFLTLPVPKEGEEYTLEELLALLEKNQIRHGIEQETLRKMLRERIYNKEVCIAVGTPVVDGKTVILIIILTIISVKNRRSVRTEVWITGVSTW